MDDPVTGQIRSIRRMMQDLADSPGRVGDAGQIRDLTIGRDVPGRDLADDRKDSLSRFN